MHSIRIGLVTVSLLAGAYAAIACGSPAATPQTPAPPPAAESSEGNATGAPHERPPTGPGSAKGDGPGNSDGKGPGNADHKGPGPGLGQGKGSGPGSSDGKGPGNSDHHGPHNAGRDGGT